MKSDFVVTSNKDEKNKCSKQCVDLPATISQGTEPSNDETALKSDSVVTSDEEENKKCLEQCVGFLTTTLETPKNKDESDFGDASSLAEVEFEQQTKLDFEKQFKAAELKIAEFKIAEFKVVKPPKATKCEIIEPSKADEPSQSLKPVDSAGLSKPARLMPAE